jgi:hypothetical protein
MVVLACQQYYKNGTVPARGIPGFDGAYCVIGTLTRIIHEVLGVEALLAAPSLFMNIAG